MSILSFVPSRVLGGARLWFAALPLFLIACTTPRSAARPPQGASPIDAGEHRVCACLLVHLTTSAAPTRAIDLAAIREQAQNDPSLCAYELLVDDPESNRANAELRPYLLQAEGAPVDLVMRPGDSVAPRVIAAGDGASLRTACGPTS